MLFSYSLRTSSSWCWALSFHSGLFCHSLLCRMPLELKSSSEMRKHSKAFHDKRQSWTFSSDFSTLCPAAVCLTYLLFLEFSFKWNSYPGLSSTNSKLTIMRARIEEKTQINCQTSYTSKIGSERGLQDLRALNFSLAEEKKTFMNPLTSIPIMICLMTTTSTN